VRGDEDGSDAGHHIASDQAGIAEQTHMAGVVAWRDEHRPRLLAKHQLFAIGKNSLTGHGASGVFAAPHGHVKGFTKQRHVSKVIAVAVREQHGHQGASVPLNGRGKHFHVLAHANGRVDHDVLTFRIAHEVAVGMVGRWQGGGLDGDDLYTVSKQDGPAPGESLGNVSRSCFHVSACPLQCPFNFHQEGDHGRSDFDFMGFPTGKNRRGFGPHYFGEFGLRLEVNVGDGGAVAKVEVEEGVVKLNGAERRCDPVAQGSNACAFNGKRTSLGERKPLGFVVYDGLSVIGVEKDCTVPAGCKAEFLPHLSHDAGNGGGSWTGEGWEDFDGSVVDP